MHSHAETTAPSTPAPATGVCCSFCHKPQSAVRKLIAGPDAAICNECVDLCNDILVEEQPAGPPGPPQDAEAGRREPVAASLDRLRRDLQAATNELRRLAERTAKGTEAGTPTL